MQYTDMFYDDNVFTSFVWTINDLYSGAHTAIREYNYIQRLVLITLLTISSLVLLVIATKYIARIFSVKGQRTKLGERPVHQVHNKMQILKEIHYAAWYCNEKPLMVERCIALLTKFPAACNLPLRAGQYTPFMRVCYHGCTELISYMLNNGADVNGNYSGDSCDPPFYLATYSILTGKCTSYEPLKLLIAAGADVNCMRRGYTALHGAAARGDCRMVRWLLSHGADVTPRSPYTPFCVALDKGKLKDGGCHINVNFYEMPHTKMIGHFSAAALLRVIAEADDDTHTTTSTQADDTDC